MQITSKAQICKFLLMGAVYVHVQETLSRKELLGDTWAGAGQGDHDGPSWRELRSTKNRKATAEQEGSEPAHVVPAVALWHQVL